MPCSWLQKQSSTWLYPYSAQQAMRSSFWWPRNCCKSSQAAVIHGEAAGGGFGGAWHPWLTAVLDKHPRRQGAGTGCSRAGPQQQSQTPSSLRPTPAPEGATPLVAIARDSAITSIKENDLRWGHLFYSHLEALQQTCCAQLRDVSLP